jgi:hypothetical protein
MRWHSVQAGWAVLCQSKSRVLVSLFGNSGNLFRPETCLPLGAERAADQLQNRAAIGPPIVRFSHAHAEYEHACLPLAQLVPDFKGKATVIGST